MIRNKLAAKLSSKSTEPKENEAGGRNLFIMTLVSIVISVGLTAVALAIYHYSGDIYLDRSRPGYLPDTAEVEESVEDEEGDYSLEKSGPITKEVLDEYLEKLEIEVKALDEYQNPFGDEVLSDEHFGLQKTETSPAE